MSELTVLVEGLKFPEGPIAMADGSVLLVEIAPGTLSRVRDHTGHPLNYLSTQELPTIGARFHCRGRNSADSGAADEIATH